MARSCVPPARLPGPTVLKPHSAHRAHIPRSQVVCSFVKPSPAPQFGIAFQLCYPGPPIPLWTPQRPHRPAMRLAYTARPIPRGLSLPCALYPSIAIQSQCMAPVSLDPSASHAAGLLRPIPALPCPCLPPIPFRTLHHPPASHAPSLPRPASPC